MRTLTLSVVLLLAVSSTALAERYRPISQAEDNAYLRPLPQFPLHGGGEPKPTRTLKRHYRCEVPIRGRGQVCPIGKRREFGRLVTGELLRSWDAIAMT